MTNVILDEYDYRKLEPRERLDRLTEVIKTDKKDESKRWDAVWLAGEILDDEKNESFRQEIAELMAWILKDDKSQVVRHEAAFQIGMRNFRDKIQNLLDCAVYDKGKIARHEAIEALAAMRVKEDYVIRALTGLTYVDDDAVSDSAKFALKRLERLKDKGEYRGEAII